MSIHRNPFPPVIITTRLSIDMLENQAEILLPNPKTMAIDYEKFIGQLRSENGAALKEKLQE
jgi:hypothetical protein